ncbi:hypothetical protein BU14_0217s0013 [Porphyra umbilicalis]|uniref:Uncharacterized protein n=1 Tax=Porphyra umbilicalis TaxID=2786 RepID=A0A1X6P4T2_PORUM|nr:hypothetical protein BU14_0217s0013 [Porphyra umbilicalis]|eukprot:OSX75899.1 hypothetical protein BU14_0217s0013 [Porphyra umbilicalis]
MGGPPQSLVVLYGRFGHSGGASRRGRPLPPHRRVADAADGGGCHPHHRWRVLGRRRGGSRPRQRRHVGQLADVCRRQCREDSGAGRRHDGHSWVAGVALRYAAAVVGAPGGTVVVPAGAAAGGGGGCRRRRQRAAPRAPRRRPRARAGGAPCHSPCPCRAQ